MAARGSALASHLTAAASVALAVFLLASPVAAAATPGRVDDTWQVTSQSWALGVVLRDGAELAGGAWLSWAEARNVTALARLPNITEPDGVTYLVLSAEGDNKAVMQVAAGVWPGRSNWSVYSWYITGIGTSSISYDWVVNGSAPSMSSGDLVSISATVTTGVWRIGARDITTGRSETWSVPSPALSAFSPGDQEVLALESYGRSPSTFRDMGNATLLGLFVDGDRITGGLYVHGGWDPTHSPLFDVGSAQPPTFISLTLAQGGQAVWSDDAPWAGEVWNFAPSPMMFLYVVLGALVPIAFVLGRRAGRSREGAR
jgi:hypothetical protein